MKYSDGIATFYEFFITRSFLISYVPLCKIIFKTEEGSSKFIHTVNVYSFRFWILAGNVFFFNVFKILENKDMRYVLNTFWNVAETCREIEDMTLYLLHI